MPKIEKTSKNSTSGSLSGSRDSSTESFSVTSFENSLFGSKEVSIGGSLQSELKEDISIIELNQLFLEKYKELKELKGIKRFINLRSVWDDYSSLRIEDSYYTRLSDLLVSLEKIQSLYEITPEFEEDIKPKEKSGPDNLSRYSVFKSKDEGREVGVVVSKKTKPERKYMVKEYQDVFEAINEVLASASMRSLLGDVIPKNKIIKSKEGRVLLFSRMMESFRTLDSIYPKSMKQKDLIIEAQYDISGYLELKAAHMLIANLDDHVFNDGFISTDDGDKVAASVDFGRTMAFRFDDKIMGYYTYLSDRYADGDVIDPIDILIIKVGSHYRNPEELYLNPSYISELRRVADCYSENHDKFYAAIESAVKNIEQNIPKDIIENYALFLGDSNDLRTSLRQALDMRVIQLRDLANNLELEYAVKQQDKKLLEKIILNPNSLTKRFKWLSLDFEGSILDYQLRTAQGYLDGRLDIRNGMDALRDILILKPEYFLRLDLQSDEDSKPLLKKQKLANLLQAKIRKSFPEIMDLYDLIIEDSRRSGQEIHNEVKAFFVPQLTRGRHLKATNVNEQKSILDKLNDAFQDKNNHDREKALFSILAISFEMGMNSPQRGSRWIESSIQSFLNFLASDKPKAKSVSIRLWREEIGLSDEKLKNLCNKSERSR